MFSVEKKFKFEAAHRLNHLSYDSPCKNFHGHSYVVFVELFSLELNSESMVLDFNKFKPFKDYIDQVWDHSILIDSNDDIDKYNVVFPGTKLTLVLSRTTSESIAIMLTEACIDLLDLNIMDLHSIKVTVSETDNNKASYTHNFKK